MNKTLSILIPTIEGREAVFNELTSLLARQINQHGLKDKIEVLTCKDKAKRYTIGWKRNKLLQGCKGTWAMFIDDDDLICDTGIVDIINLLEKHNPDCVAITGILKENGKPDRTFTHNLNYKTYAEVNGVYVRPPNHLNPIRTLIGKQFFFTEKNHGEDTDWAMDICTHGALKTQVVYEKPYYFYRFNPNK